MKGPLRVGIFGVGHAHANENIDALKKVDGVQFVGVCDPDEKLLAKKRGDAPEIYGDVPVMGEDQLLAAGLDAAIVESVVPDLTPLAEKCVDAGLHVMMDKPAGTDLAGYKRVLDKAKAQGTVFHTGYMYRYNSGFREILRNFRSGELGEIYNINAQMCTEHTLAERTRFASYDVPRPVNYVFGCHLLDLILYLMGEPKRFGVFGGSTGKDGPVTEDTTVVALEYDKGVASYKVSSVEINGPWMREFTVVGSKRTISIRPMEPACMTVADLGMFWRNEGRVSYPDKGQGTSLGRRYDLMQTDFVRAARGEEKSEFSYEHEYLLQKYLLLTSGVKI